jgi:hypothetical protein
MVTLHHESGIKDYCRVGLFVYIINCFGHRMAWIFMMTEKTSHFHVFSMFWSRPLATIIIIFIQGKKRIVWYLRLLG